MEKFRVWNQQDANNSFEVEGEDFNDAVINALNELGWSISSKPLTNDEVDP